jgi:DNA processing protein
MTACDACLRRTRLIAALAGHLDHLHAERGLMDEVFALPDEDLVAGLVSDPAERERLLQVDAPRPASQPAVCRHDPGYPAALRDLAGPPAVVFASRPDRLTALAGQCAVAIVGARRASAYGLEVARALGRGLSAAGVTVVSGMALGVDSAAHAGALDAGGLTIAVLGGGIDVPYPATKRALHARLAQEAAVVSELPPGFGPRRWTFPARNRVIAALAGVTVVVEAAQRSGALITARIARELGRDVGAVPGQIISPLACGPNDLLRDGAHLVDGPEAVLDLLFGVGARPAPPDPAHDLEPPLARVLERIRAGVGESDRAIPAETLAALGELELRGLVRRTPGGGWVAVA